MADFAKLLPLQASKLLLSDLDDDGFPYHAGGSAFTVLFQSCLLLVTANHCLTNNQVSADQICIPDGPKARTFLQFDRVSHGKQAKDADDHFLDFAMLRVKSGTVSGEQLAGLRPFPISEHTVIDPSNPAIQFFVTNGFPKDINEVDNEKKIIPNRPLTLCGGYEGDDSLHRNLWIMRYGKAGTPPTPFTNGNGMSGSPVFAITPKLDTKLHFAGMILKGGFTSGLWRVVKASVLLRALEQLKASGDIVPMSESPAEVAMDYADAVARDRNTHNNE